MRRLVIILLLFLNTCFLFSIRNWQSYTNTSAIYKIITKDNKLILPSWEVSTFTTDTNTLKGFYFN